MRVCARQSNKCLYVVSMSVVKARRDKAEEMHIPTACQPASQPTDTRTKGEVQSYYLSGCLLHIHPQWELQA